jgi:hypothetical protein
MDKSRGRVILKVPTFVYGKFGFVCALCKVMVIECRCGPKSVMEILLSAFENEIHGRIYAHDLPMCHCCYAFRTCSA